MSTILAYAGAALAAGRPAPVGEQQPVAARRHVVEAKKGTKVCAQVRLDRSGVSSTWSQVACDVAT